MMAVLREALYVCGLVIAVLCLIAALTVTVAIAIGKLQDPQAWMAAVFFAAVAIASWIAGRAAHI
jgi:hypothetical protein